MPEPHRPFPGDEIPTEIAGGDVRRFLRRAQVESCHGNDARWAKGIAPNIPCRFPRGQLLQVMDESKLIEITRPGDGQSLCRTCYWAHAQKGFRESEEATFCMFGPMRKVPFRVRDCTDYMNRTLPTRAQMEKIALIISTEPTRKKLGFSGLGFSNDSEREDLIERME